MKISTVSFRITGLGKVIRQRIVVENRYITKWLPEVLGSVKIRDVPYSTTKTIEHLLYSSDLALYVFWLFNKFNKIYWGNLNFSFSYAFTYRRLATTLLYASLSLHSQVYYYINSCSCQYISSHRLCLAWLLLARHFSRSIALVQDMPFFSFWLFSIVFCLDLHFSVPHHSCLWRYIVFLIALCISRIRRP